MPAISDMLLVSALLNDVPVILICKSQEQVNIPYCLVPAIPSGK
jgi:hypothetical protein